jgi:hypothetical protein
MPEDGAPLTVRYTITLDDFVDAQTAQVRRLVVVGTLVCLLVAVLGVVLAGGENAAIGVLLASVAAVGLALLHVRPLRRALMRRRVAPLVGTESVVTVADDGIEIVQSTSRGTLAWSGLTSVEETGGAVSVRSGGVVRMTIPRRAFIDRAHADAFVAELRRRIGGATHG